MVKPRTETYTGPYDAWEQVWQVLKDLIQTGGVGYDQDTIDQIQAAYDAITEGCSIQHE